MVDAMTTTSSEGSLCMASLAFITPIQLQQMIQDRPCSVQIVDSRSFLNYNSERITGSVNIYCPPLVKRRFQACLPLNTMLTRETKAMLCRSSVDTVVIHDQFTDEDLFRIGQSDLQLVLGSLVKFLGQRNYLILAGGYFRFRQEFPGMCSSHTSLSGQLCHLTCHGSYPKQTLSPKSPNTFQALHLNRKSHNLFSLTPAELLPYLYIGDAGHSSRMDLLRKFSITAILNVSTSCENHFPDDFRYKVIPVEDSSSANLLEWLQSAILFIEQEKESGGKILVHCQGGISRSATVCLAYLMYTRRLILDEAFEYVKSRRHIISPNANFMMQLSQFENKLRHLGFINPAASLQKPISPRRLSSVASCPDMSQFMTTEHGDADEVKDANDDISDDADNEKKRDIHCQGEGGFDFVTGSTGKDSVNNNNNNGDCDNALVHSNSGVMCCEDIDNKNTSRVSCRNIKDANVILENGNEVDETECTSSSIGSQCSNLRHSHPFLSCTLTSPS